MRKSAPYEQTQTLTRAHSFANRAGQSLALLLWGPFVSCFSCRHRQSNTHQLEIGAKRGRRYDFSFSLGCYQLGMAPSKNSKAWKNCSSVTTTAVVFSFLAQWSDSTWLSLCFLPIACKQSYTALVSKRCSINIWSWLMAWLPSTLRGYKHFLWQAFFPLLASLTPLFQRIACRGRLSEMHPRFHENPQITTDEVLK